MPLKSTYFHLVLCFTLHYSVSCLHLLTRNTHYLHVQISLPQFYFQVPAGILGHTISAAAALSHSQGSSSVAKKRASPPPVDRRNLIHVSSEAARPRARPPSSPPPSRRRPCPCYSLARGGQYFASSATEQKWVRTQPCPQPVVLCFRHWRFGEDQNVDHCINSRVSYNSKLISNMKSKIKDQCLIKFSLI